MTEALASRLYRTEVFHRRLKPRRHELRYRLFYCLIDLDELETLDKASALFAVNRRGLLSFRERDHGDGRERGLKDWAVEQGMRAGVDLAGGRVLLLTLPRLWGYLFNPISVFYAFDRHGRLAALLYEVSNTFGDRHTYVVPVEGTSTAIRQTCAKAMHVSPFNEVSGRYDFTLRTPDRRLSLAIRLSVGGAPLLSASLVGEARLFGTAELAKALLRHPTLSLGAMAAIHWEALKLWRKGVPVFRRPPPPPRPVSVVAAHPAH